MKKAFLLVVILFISVISTACINNLAVQQLNNKAKDYLDKGDYDNAISRLKSSIDLDNTLFETHYNLGIAYTQAEQYPEAVLTFQDAIKLRPNFADTYYSLAVAQENCAQAWLDGKLQIDKNLKTIVNKHPESDANAKNLSRDEKSQVSQSLEDSIASYSRYLDMATKTDDRQEVETKIEYLKNLDKKYASSKPY